MSFDNYTDTIIIPIIFPNESDRKEKWICAYLKDMGRVTVPESKLKELLKSDELVKIISTS